MTELSCNGWIGNYVKAEMGRHLGERSKWKGPVARDRGSCGGSTRLEKAEDAKGDYKGHQSHLRSSVLFRILVFVTSTVGVH